ncbi:MAG: FtsX-like permease family protein [Acidobacteriota bacterium]
MAIFAALAAVLAAVGLYGVMGYIVSRRTREIGIRMALGASRGAVVGLLVRQGLMPAAVGLTLGVAGAMAAGRYLESLLFGVRPDDPVVIGGAAVLMAVVAALAALAPTARATGVVPSAALRTE